MLGNFEKLVGARHAFMVSGALTCVPEAGSGGRPGALLVLLAPFVQRQKAGNALW